MEHGLGFIKRFLKQTALALAIMPLASIAAIHTIQFEGALGLVDSSNILTVTIGDTIRWQGDFIVHPLRSTVIPAGAAAWTVTSGTQFDYPVTVLGEYNYHCNVHFGLGMTGAFIVMPVQENENINLLSASSLRLQEIEPNPAFQSGIRIQYSVPTEQNVTLSVLDLKGRKIATLAQGQRKAGFYKVDLLTCNLPSGSYVCRLQGDNASMGRNLYIIN